MSLRAALRRHLRRTAFGAVQMSNLLLELTARGLTLKDEIASSGYALLAMTFGYEGCIILRYACTIYLSGRDRPGRK